MKIVIDARIISTSTGRYVAKLLEYLNDNDGGHSYVIMMRRADIDRYMFSNQNFTKVVADYKTYTFGEQLQFAWQLYRQKADLVHFTFHSRPILYLKPSITTIHDLNLVRVKNYDMPVIKYEIMQLVFKFVLQVMAHQSKKLIVPTQFVRQDLIHYTKIRPAKVVVTLESADKLTVPPAKIEQIANTPFIMYVGQSSPYKNARRLIEAHQRLLAKHPALRLVFIGKKDFFTEQNEAWAAKEGFKNIDFLGFIPDEQLRWAYEHALAYVAPSLMEGFGLPGLEAMYYDVPVASSNTTCSPEVYKDAAHYFNPYSVDDMTRALDELVSDKTLRESLIKKGRAVRGLYSWERMAKQTLDVYNSFVSASSAGGSVASADSKSAGGSASSDGSGSSEA